MTELWSFAGDVQEVHYQSPQALLLLGSWWRILGRGCIPTVMKRSFSLPQGALALPITAWEPSWNPKVSGWGHFPLPLVGGGRNVFTSERHWSISLIPKGLYNVQSSWEVLHKVMMAQLEFINYLDLILFLSTILGQPSMFKALSFLSRTKETNHSLKSAHQFLNGGGMVLPCVKQQHENGWQWYSFIFISQPLN